MPARTNDFQKLVKLVQHTLLPINAVITESTMVAAPGSDDEREIDILAELPAGPFRLKIAYEAKGNKRPLDVKAVETLIGEYQGGGALIVDKVVLVSKNGFSAKAKRKATANGIELLTLQQAVDADWKKFLPSGSINVNLPHRIRQVRFNPFPELTGNQPQEMEFICKCCGRSYGAAPVFANTVVFPSPAFNEWLNGNHDQKNDAFEFPLDLYYGRLKDGTRIGLSIFFVDVEFFGGQVHFDSTPYELEGETISSQQLERGVGSLYGEKIEYVVQQNGDQMVVDFGKAFAGLSPELTGPFVLTRDGNSPNVFHSAPFEVKGSGDETNVDGEKLSRRGVAGAGLTESPG